MWHWLCHVWSLVIRHHGNDNNHNDDDDEDDDRDDDDNNRNDNDCYDDDDANNDNDNDNDIDNDNDDDVNSVLSRSVVLQQPCLLASTTATKQQHVAAVPLLEQEEIGGDVEEVGLM